MTPEGGIKLRDPPKVAVKDPRKLSKYLLEPRDLLITRSGTIGIMALFRGDYRAIPSAYLIGLRFPEEISVNFFFHMLRSPYGQDLLALSVRSIGVPNVNATSMSEYLVPVPPVPEQHRIGNCNSLKRNLEEGE